MQNRKYYRLPLQLNPNIAQTKYLFSELLRRLGREEEANGYAKRAIILGMATKDQAISSLQKAYFI